MFQLLSPCRSYLRLGTVSHTGRFSFTRSRYNNAGFGMGVTRSDETKLTALKYVFP